ncbi:MAG: type II/IV secretion system ATPase subunit [Thaumarchaeota archaeon]|nr:type II/IV secretion system ATPase subunit [Nitrososphaerota archaeon]
MKRPDEEVAKSAEVEKSTQLAKAPEAKPARTFIETYPVYEPYVYIGIEQEPNGRLKYIAIEPELTEVESKLLAQINDLLKIALDVDANVFKNDSNASDYLKKEIIKILKRFEIKMRKSTFDKLMYYIVRDHLRYGMIDPLMRDPMIEDISCVGPGTPIYAWQRDFESLPTNITIPDQETLDKFIMRMAYLSGRHLSIAQPLIDSSLPDGSRIQLTFSSEVTKKGSTFTIRRFKEDPLSIIDLLRFNTIDSEMAAMIWFALEHKSSVLLAGGTASGKTTTINCLSMFIKPDAKLVTIEDTPELNLSHANWIQSISRAAISGIGEISLYDLLRAALRQRPDFIIVGEIRGAEASTLFQAISTGHAGISSVHADSVPAVLRRLASEPMSIPRNLIPAVNYILLQERTTLGEKSVRRVSTMSELVGIDPRTNEFILNDVFKYQPASDSYNYSGRSYILEKIAKNRNLSAEDVRRDLLDRKTFLEWLAKKKVRKYREVSAAIGKYYLDNEGMMNQVRIESY